MSITDPSAERVEASVRQKNKGIAVRVVQAFQNFSVIFVITFVFFATANWLLADYAERLKPWLYRDMENQAADQWVAQYGMDRLKRVYPDKSEEDIAAMLKETSVIPVTYEPYVLFRSRPRVMRYHAIHETGFRFIGSDQAAWPPPASDLNIFVFGGSTAFGQGVPDPETLPAYLQRVLRKVTRRKDINVYNFAVGAYYSTQEIISLQRLLANGFVPDAAVFVDGLNEFWRWDDIPVHNERYVRIFDDAEGYNLGEPFYFFKKWLNALPLGKLAHHLNMSSNLVPPPRDPFRESLPRPTGETVAACHKEQMDLYERNKGHNDPEKLKRTIEHYLRSIKMVEGIATIYNIRPVFVWQPIPTFEYDRCFSVFHGDLGEHSRSMFGYPIMAERVKAHWPADNFVWCADIQHGREDNLYVDNVHYNKVLNELLAQCIIERSGLLTVIKAS